MNLPMKHNQGHNRQGHTGSRQGGGEGGEGQDGCQGQRQQLLGMKSVAIGIYSTAQGNTDSICNNFKWSIIHKNSDSLCCTPKTNTVLEINCTSI